MNSPPAKQVLLKALQAGSNCFQAYCFGSWKTKHTFLPKASFKTKTDTRYQFLGGWIYKYSQNFNWSKAFRRVVVSFFMPYSKTLSIKSTHPTILKDAESQGEESYQELFTNTEWSSWMSWRRWNNIHVNMHEFEAINDCAGSHDKPADPSDRHQSSMYLQKLQSIWLIM